MPRGVPKPKPGKKKSQAIYTRHCPLNYVVAQQLIHDSGLSERELSARTGLHRKTIRAIKHGNQRKVWNETVEKLALGLHVPVAILMVPKKKE